MEHPHNKAREDARWVGRVWWNVQIQAHGFGIERGGDGSSRSKGQGQVHKVQGMAAVGEFPSETMVSVHSILKVFPFSGVVCWVRWYPNAKDVIDESPIVEYIVGKIGEKALLMDAIVDGGIGGRRWRPHRCATKLFPGGIAKGEDIMAHNQIQRSYGRFSRDSFDGVGTEVGGDFMNGNVSWDVGIHGYGISTE